MARLAGVCDDEESENSSSASADRRNDDNDDDIIARISSRQRRNKLNKKKQKLKKPSTNNCHPQKMIKPVMTTMPHQTCNSAAMTGLSIIITSDLGNDDNTHIRSDSLNLQPGSDPVCDLAALGEEQRSGEDDRWASATGYVPAAWCS